MNNRDHIPSEIKRKVRQKCKFACIICRCPIYDYEHLVDYSICKEHTVKNIFLLCPNCHRKKTNGTISHQQILESEELLTQFHTTKPEKIYNKEFTLIIGNNKIKTFNGYLFRIIENNYFLFKNVNNEKLIDAVFYDENNNKALIIENSEYTLFTDAWDILYEGGWIILKKEDGKVYLKIKFDAQKNTIYILGKYYLSRNDYLEINKDGIFYKKKLLLNNSIVEHANKTGLLITSEKERFCGSYGFCNCLSTNDSKVVNADYGFTWTKEFLEKL
jgi:trigger factor